VFDENRGRMIGYHRPEDEAVEQPLEPRRDFAPAE